MTVTFEDLRRQQQQQQAEQWAGLQEHFAARGQPNEPDPEQVARMESDRLNQIAGERARRAASDALMAGIAESFAKRAALKQAMRQVF